MFQTLIFAIAILFTAFPNAFSTEERRIESFEVLTLDGANISINNFSERKGTAIVFLSSRCEYTDRALDAIITIHNEYRLQDFLFVGVCPNEEETGDELREYAQNNGVIFPLYRDPSGKTAKDFGATITPGVFILDSEGVIQYHGGVSQIDQSGIEIWKNQLTSAVVSVLQGKAVNTSSSKILGTKIDNPGPPKEFINRFGTLSFSSELIFEKIPGAVAHHCSTITELGNGDLLCVWYGGSYESSDDQALYMSRRRKGDRNWSLPEKLVQDSIQPPGNAVVFVDNQKRVWIIWGRMESRRPIRRGGGWGDCRLMVRTSNDHGKTWSDDRLMSESIYALPRNAPITLKDGTLIVPLSGRIEDSSGSFLLATKDDGATWSPYGFFQGGIQPTVVERDDGSLLALMRNKPTIVQSVSNDGGKTWREPIATSIPNPNAGIALRKLKNGHLVLVYNHSEKDRTPLCIRRSLDNGSTWEEPLNLESNPGEYSYPCVVQDSEGIIHITYTFRRYTIKHVEMNEDWLIHLKRPN